MEGIKRETKRQGFKCFGLYQQGEGGAAGVCPLCDEWEAELPRYDEIVEAYCCNKKRCRQKHAIVVLRGVTKE